MSNQSVFLIGYRGTGKSSIARHLAELMQLDWIDSDDLVEQRAGKSIAEIFGTDGEAGFRDVEQQVVAEICAGPANVVALGGGAVLREATRERLASAGPSVWLTALPETIAQRLAADSSSNQRRPSLTDRGLLGEIEQVLADREPIYRECATLVVDTEARTPLEVAEQIARQLANLDAET